jgi:hypothetical protein
MLRKTIAAFLVFTLMLSVSIPANGLNVTDEEAMA